MVDINAIMHPEISPVTSNADAACEATNATKEKEHVGVPEVSTFGNIFCRGRIRILTFI